jgi:hypothetical protein
MPTLSDPNNIEALLDALKSEKRRRLQERVDAGEQAPVIVMGLPGGAADRGPDDDGPITVIITGVPCAGDPPSEYERRKAAPLHPSPEQSSLGEKPAAVQALTGEIPSPSPASTTVATLGHGETAREAASDTVSAQSTYIWVTIRPPTDGDPGEIAEGLYSVAGDEVVVTDRAGKRLGTQTLQPDEDARRMARQILRAAAADQSFSAPIRYPRAVVA